MGKTSCTASEMVEEAESRAVFEALQRDCVMYACRTETVPDTAREDVKPRGTRYYFRDGSFITLYDDGLYYWAQG